jgi:hypothetical protein
MTNTNPTIATTANLTVADAHIDDLTSRPQCEEVYDEYAYRGWSGDGSGEDDLADFNQMEGNDY